MSWLRTLHLNLTTFAATVVLGVGGGTLIACDQGEGAVIGDSLFVADCKGISQDRLFEPFSMSIEKLGFNEDRGVVSIRLSSSFQPLDRSDVLAIALADAAALRDEIATSGSATRQFINPGAVGTVLPEPGAAARAGLILLERCTFMPQSLVAGDGTITLTALGRDRGDVIKGQMTFEVVDRRSGDVVGRGFAADFDFEIDTGTPYTSYTPDEDYWSLD